MGRTGNRFFWLPVALAAAACIVLIMTSSAAVISVWCSVVLAAAGVLAGRWLSQSHARAIVSAGATPAAPAGKLRELCTRTLPVWQRQIDTSRDEADKSVADLSRAFGAIAQRLDKVLQVTQLDDAPLPGRASLLDVIARSGSALNGLVDALKELQQSRDGMVRDIGAQAASLRDNAVEVRSIALQTRILTLNAAIEAARAGAAGAPFAVIVGDMRQLAARTAETSEHISKQTETLNAAVAAAFRESSADDAAASAGTRAQAVIGTVVRDFRDITENLSAAIEAMARERGEVRLAVSDALVSLQFQDRVSQILSHVTHSMQTLAARLSQPDAGAADIDAWLGEMSAAYTMQEEFANLHSAGRADAPATREVTYF